MNAPALMNNANQICGMSYIRAIENPTMNRNPFAGFNGRATLDAVAMSPAIRVMAIEWTIIAPELGRIMSRVNAR